MSTVPKTFVLLLLLAFAGQSVLAASTPCLMMSGPADDMPHDMSAMGHAGHEMPAAGDAPQPDCCGGGYCSASNCEMVPGVPSPVSAALTERNFVLTAAELAPAVISPTETRFRPPATP